MSREIPLFPRGDFKAEFDSTDLKYQYTFVKRVESKKFAGTGMGNITVDVAQPGEQALGVLQGGDYAGGAVNVMQFGVSPARIDVSAAAGKVNDYLAVGPNGALVKAGSGDFAVAQAEENYGPGEISTVTVFPFGKQ